ncbi:MAG TPA: DUF4124 domain-containing protein [Nevskiaceae bacterium]|nr:DUF4124 domain-containing protein [Nevskiaceae bacterium]
MMLLLPALASAGEMYRWVDKDGTVHYTQTPPPSGTEGADKIKDRAPPATAPRSGLQKLSDQYDAEQKKKAEEAAKNAQGADDRAQLCQKARSNLDQMATHPAHRLATNDEQGNPSRMTTEQYDRIKAESENDVRLYCEGE